VESGNDYVIQVKGNQPKLLKAVKQTIRDTNSVDIDYTLEKNRGRIEEREVHVYSYLDNSLYDNWFEMKRIIHVVSRGFRNGTDYCNDRYYISNKKCEDAIVYNKGIRNHWGIENGLHWVKDVILIEDKSMVLDLERSENMSVMRNIVMNLYRMNGYRSIKYAIEEFTNKLKKCIMLVYGNDIY
jgi:predicted transposase YbfD/YdcC